MRCSRIIAEIKPHAALAPAAWGRTRIAWLAAPQGVQRRELGHAGHPSLALLGRTTEDEGVKSFGRDR